MLDGSCGDKNVKYDLAPQEVLGARPVAIRFTKEISAFANKKWTNGAQMSAVIATLILQRIVFAIVASVHPPGSAAGLKFIESFYDGAKRDALNWWNEEDLSRH